MEGNRRQSEFNDAVGYLNRINSILYTCDNAAMELDAFNWFHSLLSFYRELSTEMNETEIEEWDKKIKEINNKVSSNQQEINQVGANQINEELYMLLHTFELGLRKVYKQSGLQIRLVEDAAKALK